MKSCILAISTAVSTLVLSSTVSAHVPSKDAAISFYNWTGFYAGLNIGALKSTLNITDNQATTFFATIQQVSNPSFTGGFQAGYRRQLYTSQTSGVYGVEFSGNYASAGANAAYGSPYALYQLNIENKLKDLYLLQLIGGIATDRTLLFLAAGLSWTNIKGNVTNIDGIPFFDSFNINQGRIGAAVGGGIEYAFSEQFSARIKVDYVMPNNYSVTNDTGNQFQLSNNIVQGTFGVNYKFG